MIYIQNLQQYLGLNTYILLQDNELLSTLNPNKATSFNSFDEAFKFVSKYIKNIDSINLVNNISEDIEIFNKWTNNPIIYKEKVLSESSYKYTNENAKDVFLWILNKNTILAKNEGTFRSEDVYTWQLESHFSNISNIDCFIDNNEVVNCIEMKVSENSDFESFQKELSLLLSYHNYKAENTDLNCLAIPIFDHECCQFAKYYLFVYENGKYSIDTDSLQSDTLHNSFDLEYIFKYWKEYRYY